MYALIHNDTGNRQKTGFEVWGTIISRHRTQAGAEKAFKRRNRHLFDRPYAQLMGLLYAGTFDEIVEIDSKNIVIGR